MAVPPALNSSHPASSQPSATNTTLTSAPNAVPRSEPRDTYRVMTMMPMNTGSEMSTTATEMASHAADPGSDPAAAAEAQEHRLPCAEDRGDARQRANDRRRARPDGDEHRDCALGDVQQADRERAAGTHGTQCVRATVRPEPDAARVGTTGQPGHDDAHRQRPDEVAHDDEDDGLGQLRGHRPAG